MTTPKYFRVETSGDTLVLSTIGNIDGLFEHDMKEECDALLDEVARRQAKHLVIDLGTLGHFGSLMLYLLSVLWKRIDAMSGKLVLCNLSSVGKQVVQASKLDSIWAISPSREEALASIQR
jgi:anti-anti-sigma factor